MALAPGTRVGGYEVVALLGAGGMGEVYRARDSRLQRDVALKLLPEHFAGDPERLARFEREAHVLASLGHTNIAHIYGLEGGALVLELVDGPTLGERIAAGPVPLTEAVAIARQLADALDAAHEHGIVHRDLKPANIKVRQDGTVKVLDFGLAKHSPAAAAAGVGAATLSPTLSMAFTGAGVILGTAAYMAPEQARGKAVDKRADVWAFGCVLYEMLTGKRAFDGTDATEVIAAVVRAEPDWRALPAETPRGVERLLKRCLEKDPRKRLRDIGDAAFELEHALEPDATIPPPARAGTGGWKWHRLVAGATAMLAIAGVGGYAAWSLRAEPPRQVARFRITLPDAQQFSSVGRHVVAISPSGSHVVYVAEAQLFLRAIDQLDATPIRGTAGVGNAAGRSPFFSPDGQWIGFWQDGQLKKVAVTGGAPVTLCLAGNPWGVSWAADDTILFGQGPDGISRVAGTGGKPEVVIQIEPGESAHGPQLLPDGRTVLFTLKPAGAGAWDQSRIVAQSLDSRERKVLVEGGTDARYIATGHLVFAQQNTLLAVPFDAARLEVTDGPVPLVEGVARANDANTGAGHFAISSTGTLVYVSGLEGALFRRTLVWVDRQGREEPVRVPPRAYRYPRISPDGTQVAMDIQDENRDAWVLNLSGGTLTRLTLDAAQEQYAVWTRDQKRIIFSSSRSGQPNLFWQAADGTGAAERLSESAYAQFPQAVTPDGSWLIYREGVPKNGSDILRMPLQGDRRSERLIATPFDEMNAEPSPDGRWLAYQSNESGRDEIYVRPFPKVNDGRWQVSTEGGTRPLWSRKGNELFYIAPVGPALMKVEVTATDSAFAASTPVKLLDAQSYAALAEVGRSADISPDGTRFLIAKPAAEQGRSAASLIVIENWLEEVKRRVVTR